MFFTNFYQAGTNENVSGFMESLFLIVLKNLLYLNFSFHQSVPTSKYLACNVNYFPHYFLGQHLSINGWWLHLFYCIRPCKGDLLLKVKWWKTQYTIGFIFNRKWMCTVFFVALKYKCTVTLLLSINFLLI